MADTAYWPAESSQFMLRNAYLQAQSWPVLAHGLADVAIACGCFSVFLATRRVARRRPDLLPRTVAWLLAAPVFLCAASVLLDLLTAGEAVTAFQATARVMVAGASIVMAYKLRASLPRILTLPSRTQVAVANARVDRLANDLRHAAEALHVSEWRCWALAKALGSVVWRIDAHGRTVEAYGWQSLTGQPDSALLDGSWSDLVHPDDLAAFEAALAEQRASQTRFDLEHRVRAPDGHGWLWVHARIIPILDAEGRCIESLGVIENITERRQAEEQRRTNEAMLRSCLESGMIGVYQRDQVAGGILCGPETRRLHGLPMNDAPVPTKVWEDTILPEDREQLRLKMTEAAVQRRHEGVFTYRIRHPASGDIRHLEVRTRYTPGANGAPAMSYGAVIDVTKIREAEKLLRLCLEAGRIGDFRYDLEAGTIKGGPETRAIFGLPDLPEIPVAEWLNLVLPDDRGRVMAETEQIRAKRLPEANVNYRIHNRLDNRIHHIETRVRYDYGADGKLLQLVGVVIDVTERREAEARVAHLAHHDVLTGLPNRALFHEHLNNALARAQRGEGFAVLCLDLDRFKEVNDTLGHPVGDALLQAVTLRLRQELRETDTLARLGGDEFAVIQSSLDQSHDATVLARRLVEAVNAPFELDGHQVVVGVSIGIAVAPGDGLEADILLKGADMALYRAKADGRGCWRFFEPEMDTRMQLRRALELDLRRALAMKEFELFYQPIVDVGTRQVKGLEALIRWRHPQRGLVPPDAFVPLAEEIGLIIPLGEWVLQRACADATTWSGTPKVAVNLSPAQFTSRGLVDAVRKALEDSGLAPERLELEITETVMLQDTEGTLAILHRLKALGVRIAMDDFGTGYSSLSYLQRFPFDKVKIDRSFTRELEQSRQSNAIVRAITQLCTGLEMTTTAEGVETETQFRALQRKGCQEAQGYLFSKPRPADEIPTLLAQLEQLRQVDAM